MSSYREHKQTAFLRSVEWQREFIRNGGGSTDPDAERGSTLQRNPFRGRLSPNSARLFSWQAHQAGKGLFPASGRKKARHLAARILDIDGTSAA
jgi:hypothetical protein